MIEIFDKASPIIHILNANGYEAYFVGGSVRDFVMNRHINDIDIATSATPEEVKEIFDHTIDVGIEHGTVLVLFQKDKYEVTTFRTESTYSDFRRPDSVHFVRSLKEDLNRRDFTMNALAMSSDGKIVDYFHGLDDIQSKIIKAVGNPNERFHEDALRMLRAVRFQAQLGFQIEEQTFSAIKQNAAKLAYVSQERITIEFEKILLGKHPNIALSTLIHSELIHHLTGLNGLEDELLSLNVEKLASIEEKWAYLFIHTGLGHKQFLRAWKCSNEKIKEITAILDCYQIVKETGWSKRLIFNYGIEVCKSADRILVLNGFESIDLVTQYRNLKIKKIQDLAVNGQDLMSWTNQKGGPWIRSMIDHLINQVLEENLMNEKEKIKEWVLSNL